jgi:hypothetical protein
LRLGSLAPVGLPGEGDASPQPKPPDPEIALRKVHAMGARKRKRSFKYILKTTKSVLTINIEFALVRGTSLNES